MKLKKDFNLENVVIGLFSLQGFYCSGKYFEGLRDNLWSNFDFKEGILFNAAEFADVSDKWGISFSILKSKDFDSNYNKEWTLNVEKFEKGEIKCVGRHTYIIIPEEESCSAWIREPVHSLPNESNDYVQLSSALKVSSANAKPSGSLKEKAFGYMVNVANNVFNSTQDVYFLSSSAYKGHGVSVNKENWERVIANFAARKLAIDTWINHQDCFHIPDSTKQGYIEWLNDSAVWFIFNTKNSAASARNFPYKNKSYTLVNETFPYDKEIIMKLSDKHNNDDIYNDAKTSKSRYMKTWLDKRSISDDATKVLDLGLKVIETTFPHRKSLATLNPEMYLNTWDAGWYQIKFMLKNCPDSDGSIKQLKLEFDDAYKALTEKLRPGIFEFGFLKE